MEQQIDQLAKELASTTPGADPVATAERWRTLALYQDAAENTNEATAAAMKVVELQPESIPGWTLLANLYERTGRLGDAADAMKKLASLDRRGISEYLRKTARLQVRLGQFDAAVATGRDVIKATPGNPEAYQFFADLAFEVGQPKIAVDSLRQAVRVNPGDEASLKALAKTLADEFQTPEAIELYWRAFEKAPDLESQTQIVVALSNLYLRSNQFPKLIERLELRSRELNLPTEMTRCIATAYREAGDFRTARMTLERLSSGTAEQAVLRELHFLASREQNDAVADDLARRILSQSDIENPEFDTDRPLSPETIDKAETPDSILRLLRQPVTEKNLDEQISLCRQYLKTRPDDWAVLNALAILLHRTGHAAESVELAMAVLRMPADPKEHGSMGGLLSLQLEITPDALSTHADLLTIEFGVDQRQFTAAWCQCLDLVLLESEPVRPELVAELLSKSNMDRFDDVPCWFMAKYVPGNSPVAESLLTQLSRLTVDDGWDQSRCLTYRLLEATLRLRVGKSNAEDLKMSRDAVVRQLPQLILETPSHFQRLPLSDCLWHMFKDAQESSRELARQINRTIDGVKLPESQAAVAAVALALKDDELLRKSVASLTPTSLDNRSSPFCDMLRIIVDRSGFMNAPNLIMPSGNLKLITTLVTIACRHESLSSTVEQTLYQTVDQRFNTVGDKDWESHLFPLKTFAEHLLMIMEWDDDHGEAMIDQWAAESMADPDSLFQARVHLLLADRELGDPQLHLIRAAELMPSVPGLRFDVAREAAAAKLWPEAIELLDSLTVTETSARIEIESNILEWSLAAGNKERARLAAKRLFGLPIDQNQQMQLASRLSQLGLEEELASLNARLGRGAETRQSVLGGSCRRI